MKTFSVQIIIVIF